MRYRKSRKRWLQEKLLLSLLMVMYTMVTVVVFSEDAKVSYDATIKGVYKGIYVAPDPTKTFNVNVTGGSIGGGSDGATEPTQLLIKEYIRQLNDNVATETTLAMLLSESQKFTYNNDDLKVKFSNDSIGVTGTFWQQTQPVSGSVSISNFPATQPISAESLPLPTGAASELKLNIVAGYLKNLSDALGETVTTSFSMLTLSDVSTWYEYVVPVGCVGLSVSAREGYDWLVSSDQNGSVYEKVWAGDRFVVGGVGNTSVSGKLYFNSPDATGLVLQIRTTVNE